MTPHKPQQVAYPRQIVSVDQVLSPNPGLEAYMTGILSTKIYKYATVFVDHLSRYSYMHFQKTSSAEDTIGGKHAFKRMSASHGIIIKQYHADSGIFRASAWIQCCQESSNTHLKIYAGLDAHHTNSLSEKIIRDIRDNGRAMMLHSKHKCPKLITTNLWHYAIICTNNAYSATPFLAQPQGLSPLHLFTGTQS